MIRKANADLSKKRKRKFNFKNHLMNLVKIKYIFLSLTKRLKIGKLSHNLQQSETEFQILILTNSNFKMRNF